MGHGPVLCPPRGVCALAEWHWDWRWAHPCAASAVSKLMQILKASIILLCLYACMLVFVGLPQVPLRYGDRPFLSQPIWWGSLRESLTQKNNTLPICMKMCVFSLMDIWSLLNFFRSQFS